MVVPLSAVDGGAQWSKVARSGEALALPLLSVASRSGAAATRLGVAVPTGVRRTGGRSFRRSFERPPLVPTRVRVEGVPVFLGTYEPRLDDKCRLVLPAKFRDQLAEGLVITKGQEHCLCVWPAAEFAAVTRRMGRAPVTSRSARDYLRVLFAGATDEIPDRQGRIVIPRALREYAGLRRDCTVIGANTRVEVWDSAAWRQYLAAQDETFAELSQEVLPGLP